MKRGYNLDSITLNISKVTIKKPAQNTKKRVLGSFFSTEIREYAEVGHKTKLIDAE